MSVDFPRAWQIARAAKMEDHHPKCSFRQTDGAVLCDCEVLTEHPEYKDDVLQGKDGVPCRSQAEEHREIDSLKARLAERDAEVERLKKLIDRDRTGLAAALGAVRQIIRGYGWIAEGVWGSYSYEEQTEETLRREIGAMYDEALAVIQKALHESGDRATVAFHPDRGARILEVDDLRECVRELEKKLGLAEARAAWVDRCKDLGLSAALKAGLGQAEELNEARAMVKELQEQNDCLCRRTYCAYCGEEFPLDTVTAEQVGEHIRTCEKHPMRQVEAERDVALAQVALATEHLEREKKSARQKEVEHTMNVTLHWWNKGYAKMAEEALKLLGSDVKPLRVKVVEAKGYVCGLTAQEKNGREGMIGYGYSYWSLICPDFKPGTELLFVPRPGDAR